MKKIKDFYLSHKYIWIVIIYFIGYLPWYFGIQQRDPSSFFDMYVKLDGMIPFTPIFIYPYIYWFAFVFFTGIYFFLLNKEEFYKYCLMLFGGMTICLIIFTIFPTTFNYRPNVVNGTFIEKYLINFIYSADKPTNVFPSIHVYNSLACAVLLTKRFKRNIPMFIFSWTSALLITLSTMFIKQHSIMDAIVAIIICIFMYYITFNVFTNYRNKKQHTL